MPASNSAVSTRRLAAGRLGLLVTVAALALSAWAFWPGAALTQAPIPQTGSSAVAVRPDMGITFAQVNYTLGKTPTTRCPRTARSATSR